MHTYHLELPAGAPLPGPGDEVRLDAEESHHLLHVMRARAGDALRLVDGRAGVVEAEYVGADGRRARARVRASRRDDAELARPRLVLACGVTKGKRFESTLEQAVELGAHEIVPLLTARGEVLPGDGRRERWRTLLRTAGKQSGRSWTPDLAEPAPPAALLAARPGARFFTGAARDRARGWRDDGDGRCGPASLLAAAAAADADLLAADELVWCVGPEGGWEDAELALLAAAGRTLRLGPHRLRTGTAALAGLALLAAVREMIVEAGPPPGAG
ncbi:MAG: RsmE family RNA methyltransferase [bacterium]|nr:RsmE family RNA methyltransferase [bacterium]